MKAILIKDDRDIKFLDVRYQDEELYCLRTDGASLLKITASADELKGKHILKEIYELICIRKNGDLVYRLKR